MDEIFSVINHQILGFRTLAVNITDILIFFFNIKVTPKRAYVALRGPGV
jgi:hypothetical protein